VAISFSRPDPSSPAAVGSAQFDVVRRGYSQEEVRDFLRMVSAEMSRLQERERFLESELRSLQTRGLSSPGVLDEETITTLLGEETARVLSVAREAAQQMRLRAAETAERLVREASADASRIRQEAELEAGRKREDASADVENEIELAKQQGREMVNEAREYRERVLAELARRRELAREQIEMLIHARDRLVKAFERARVAANDVVGDLDEFEELSEEVARASQMQTPQNGPVFFDHTKVPDAIPQRVDDVSPIETEISDESEVVEDVVEDEVIEVVIEVETLDIEDVVVDEPSKNAESIESTTEETALKAGHPSMEPQGDEHIAEVVQLFGRRDETPKVETKPESTPEPSMESQPLAQIKPKKTSVDDLFAKLKQSSPAKVAESVKSAKDSKPTKPKTSTDRKPSTPKAEQGKTVRPKAVVPKVNTELFLKRDETLAPQIVNLTRKFKRVLADEENAILTYLQGKKSVVALEKIVADAASQVQSHVDVVADEAHNIALSGAKSVAPGLKADLRKQVTKTAVLQTISKSIDETIVRPIRERLQRCVEQCNGDREEMSSLVRSAYREWKMQKLEPIVADMACLAYSRGAYLALPTGTPVCWMVDPNGPQCADAEDNALAGDTPLGSPFPTGHEHPIAHAGCRCLVAPHRD
jgi:DivIVA domain-containing protein